MGKTKTQFIGETLEDTKPKKSSKKEEPTKVRVSGQKGGERVKLVESEPITLPEETSVVTKRARKAKVRGKKYLEAKSQVDRARLYPLPQAIELVKKTSVSSFDGTVELHLVVKKEGQTFNVDLPHSTGKAKKVEIADEDTLKKLESGKIDFDVLLATADMMPKLVPFARLLGPRGLMPNPKNGTIIKSAKDADKFSSSRISVKTEKKAPVVHTVVGKVSMKKSELLENAEAILSAVNKKQIAKAYLTASMGPSVKLNVA